MVKQNKNIFFGKLQIIFPGFFNNLESVLNQTSTDLYYDFWIVNNIMLLDWIFWMLIISFWHFLRKIFLINTSMVARSITLYNIFWTIRNETVAMLNWIPEFIKVEFPSGYPWIQKYDKGNCFINNWLKIHEEKYIWTLSCHSSWTDVSYLFTQAKWWIYK